MSNQTVTRQQEIAFTVPLLPGKAEADRQEMLSCWHGARSAAHRASRTRLGITHESVWIQPTPAGEVVVVHLQARDIEAALGGMATSTDPFDVWFREHVSAVHGVDLTQPLPPLEQILGFAVDAVRR